MYKIKINHHYLIGDDFFMKKILCLIVIIFIVTSVKASNFVIPEDAIRVRVIANSNSEYDQEIKLKIKEMLEIKMYNLLKDIKGVESARNIINNNLNNIENEVKNILEKENYTLGYNISFGDNYFPEKKYNGVTYEEGYYESLVVTLGKGEGDNWWCVLFPPLCLLEAEESEEVEYKFFILSFPKHIYKHLLQILRKLRLYLLMLFQFVQLIQLEI